METNRDNFGPRSVRVAIPVLASFSNEAYTVRDFTLNLSEGGIFLPTEKICPIGTTGQLKFRLSQFDKPFTLQARVVRVVAAGEETHGQRPGLGLQFDSLEAIDLQRLKRLVDGVHDGSVVESIRRALREGGGTLDQELRSRPIDQKMMLAINANGQEISALIRDGNPSVLIRLLDCPRLTSASVASMLKNKSLPTRVLSEIRKARRWLAAEESRWLFCVHPNAAQPDALAELRLLSRARQRRIAQDASVRAAIRSKAADLSRASAATRR